MNTMVDEIFKTVNSYKKEQCENNKPKKIFKDKSTLFPNATQDSNTEYDLKSDIERIPCLIKDEEQEDFPSNDLFITEIQNDHMNTSQNQISEYSH